VIARGIGCVKRTLGETILAALPGARVGDGVTIRCASGASLRGEVASVERSRVAIAPFGPVAGVAVGDAIAIDPAARCCPAGFAALGRAFDAAGVPLDKTPSYVGAVSPVNKCGAPAPAERAAVTSPFWTGIRAIDGLLTIGRGARLGFFGAPGAGKTTLLETIAAGARGDAIVIALVGERGREAQRWCERVDRRTTLICATSDRCASERVRAADIAMTQAQRLRDRGLHVVLVLDSLARYAAALREQRVGLGEPVGRGGYPPSVWGELARYLECAGNGPRGSITLLATVLSDGADEREPLSDAARSLLDGHIVLSSALARAGHFPAIDVLESTSRTCDDVIAREHAGDAHSVRRTLALLARTMDARSVGLGGDEDPALRAAVAAEPAINAFLQQSDSVAPAATRRSLRSLAALVEGRL
jgi:FliI/YscN family ATPase